MSQGNNKEQSSENLIHQAPQIIYSYPFPGSNNDEIDLGDLIAKIFAQYKLILGITIIGTLLAVAIALYMPNVYQKEVVLSKPNMADITSLNSNGYTTYTTGSIFEKYHDVLRSPRQFENYINENKLLASFFPDSNEMESALIAGLRESFIIEILESQPKGKSSEVTSPTRIALKLNGEKEQAVANFLNGYVNYTESLMLSNLAVQQKIEIAAELKDIDRKITLLRSAEMRARESEMARIDEAYEIAKKLKIIKPAAFENLGKSGNSTGNSGKSKKATEGDKEENSLADIQNFPMYFMGTEYLDAKREELKVRMTDDPYIEELPELIDRKSELAAMSLDFNNLKLARVEQSAQVTGIKIKPNRVLIVAIGGLLSCLLALFIALIVSTLPRSGERR